MAAILLVNGPNLNLLGTREPEVYGSDTILDVVRVATEHADARGFELRHVQSNHEGELVDALHDARDWAAGVVMNPGAYTHTSVALRDAIAGIDLPVVEVHLSNVHAREDFRQRALTSGVCVGVVTGFGLRSYTLGIDALLDHLGR